MTDNNNNPQVIISMTSFPAAITIAEQAIRSLLKGSVLPDKLILYVTMAQFAENEMPQSLLALAKENPIFEIRNYDRDIRSYRKLIPALIDFFEEVPEYDSAMYCHKKMKTNEETSLTVLKEVLPVLEEQEDYTNDPLFETLSAFVKEHGYKNGYVMWPLRTAVSGKQMTPAGATEIMEIIGKDETIKRVKAAIEKLSK